MLKLNMSSSILSLKNKGSVMTMIGARARLKALIAHTQKAVRDATVSNAATSHVRMGVYLAVFPFPRKGGIPTTPAKQLMTF